MEFLLFPNQSDDGKYNLLLVLFIKFQNLFFCVYDNWAISDAPGPKKKVVHVSTHVAILYLPQFRVELFVGYEFYATQ